MSLENTIMPSVSQSTPKHHCMVVHAYYPLAETRVQREAEALLANGFEVDVICLRLPDEAPEEVVGGINVYRLPIQRNRRSNPGRQLKEYLHFFLLATLKLMQLHRQKRYRVVQAHNLPDFLVFCTLWPKLTGARVILDIHDVMPEFFAERSSRSLDSWAIKPVIWQEQLSCRLADLVITVTEPWRQVLIGRGIPPDKIRVVMNVADANLFNANAGARLAGRPADDTFRLIYHGVQERRHGLDTLLHAVGKVGGQIPNLHLTLHGQGNFHDELVRLAADLKLEEQVQFSTRVIPIQKLPQFIAGNDIGIVPYRRGVFTDGILPTKLMEYVALRMPVIASRTPAIEAYFDGTMVHFFEPGNSDDLADAILTLYRDSRYRKDLVKQSVRFIRQHNWAAESAHYVKLVNQLNSVSHSSEE